MRIVKLHVNFKSYYCIKKNLDGNIANFKLSHLVDLLETSRRCFEHFLNIHYCSLLLLIVNKGRLFSKMKMDRTRPLENLCRLFHFYNTIKGLIIRFYLNYLLNIFLGYKDIELKLDGPK